MAMVGGTRGVTVTDQDYEMHVLRLSRSKLKSSMGTSTLLAGFALVRFFLVSCSKEM